MDPTPTDCIAMSRSRSTIRFLSSLIRRSFEFRPPIRAKADLSNCLAWGFLLLTIAGCGTLVVDTDYPNRLVDAAGRTIFLDDVEAIVNNPELTDDQRREQLRALGLQDEELIDALLQL